MDIEKAKAAFKKNVGALTDGNPCKPDGGLETNLAAFWFDVGAQWAWGEREQQVKFLVASAANLDAEHTKEILEVEKLQAENKKLRECVEFYAETYFGSGVDPTEEAVQCLKEIEGE